MEHFLIGCVLGAAIVAAIGVPLLAPWPFRVRYLANATTIDPLLGLGPTTRLEMRAVTPVAVDVFAGGVELVAEEVGTREPRRVSLTRVHCAPAVVAELDGWAATRTPLLMIVDDDDAVHLYGPDGAVTNLSRAGAKVR